MCSSKRFSTLVVCNLFVLLCRLSGSQALPVNSNQSNEEVKEYITADGKEYEVKIPGNQTTTYEADQICRCFCRDKWGDGHWKCCECQILESGCFPSRATVSTPARGTVLMSELQVGDIVLAGDEHGTIIEEPVLGFLHRSPHSILNYLKIDTESGHSILLSKSHILFTAEQMKPGKFHPRPADSVSTGDFLRVTDNDGKLFSSKVTKVSSQWIEGLYVPFTASGTIIVNGVHASNYASFDHHKAHSVLAPLRWWPQLSLSHEEEGLPVFVKAAKAAARTLQVLKIV